MFVPPADAWKLVLAVTLFAAVIASACLRPPRQRIPGAELGRLVLGAVALYGAGLFATLTHHSLMAVILYSCGIAISAFAAWLSRANADTDPPPSEEPVDEPSPPPDGAPRFDWAQFEREFADYTRRENKPVSSG
jgi:hypothetical protein